jgi:hypothetical protein
VICNGYKVGTGDYEYNIHNNLLNTNPQILANIIGFLSLTYIILGVKGGAYGYS